MKKTIHASFSAVTLAYGLLLTSALPAETLYWVRGDWSTATSGISQNWATESGGVASAYWTNGSSAVFEADEAVSISFGSNSGKITVATLAISNVLSLTGSGNAARVLEITEGGSGNLTLATTTDSGTGRIIFSGSSAWAGTISTSADAGAANRNNILVENANAVGTDTKLNLNGAQLRLNGAAGDTFTIGELKGGAGGSLLFTTSSGSTKTLIVDQSSDTTFAGAITESTAAGTSILTKTGSGSLTLGGTVSIDRINVTGGSLVADGAITSAISVSQGGKLSGVGSVGAVTLNDGAVLSYSLGAGAQNLTVAGFVKGTAGTYVFDFGGTGVAGESYTLSSVVGSGFDASNFSAVNLAEGVTGMFTLSGSELKFVTMVIPEPSAYAFLAGGVFLAGALIMRRRCR